MTLGNLSVTSGTAADDSLTGSALEVVLGLSGDDDLTSDSSGISVLAGGLDDDNYFALTGDSIAILDSGGSDDSLYLPLINFDTVFTIDNQHLFVGDSNTQTAVTILNWRDPQNKIESFIDDLGTTVSYEDLAAAVDNGFVDSFDPTIYEGDFSIQNTDPFGYGYIDPITGLTPDSFYSFINEVSALAVGATFPTAPLDEVKRDPARYMSSIRDYDGNDLGSSSSWIFRGEADVQGDGDIESLFVNPSIERWATVGAFDGSVEFANHGFAGDTRVVGIYIDPTLKDKPENIGGPFDSQRRFQNDLRIDNLSILAADDYDKDGFQELYFGVRDGSSVLRALMHEDGNIQYANYQSQADLTNFMTANGVSSSIWGSWF